MLLSEGENFIHILLLKSVTSYFIFIIYAVLVGNEYITDTQ